MRPERLELEGFTAFRDRVEIDFSDAELFALVGPTGSGKSSIVDAITFALYGSVPRLRKGRVEPIVSLGAERARVRFDFSIGDAAYTAARVVHRTKTGATTAEARLEGGPVEVVGATELTEAVEGLLGLSYEHFIKCVVLPQGEFASFLLDGPKDRQALLRELLDLGRFGRVRDLAKKRAASSRANADALAAQIEDLGDVTEASVASTEERIERADRVASDVEARAAQAAELRRRLDGREAAIAEREGLLERLRRIESPSGVGELSQASAGASAEVDAASKALSEATAVLERARRAASEAGDAADVARRITTIERLAELDARIETGVVRVDEAEMARAALEAEATRLDESAREVESRLSALQAKHRAHGLRSELEVGDECPVCHGRVTGPPDPAPEGIDDLAETAAKARSAAAAAQRALIEASARHRRDAEFLAGLVEERDELRSRAGSDTPEALAVARKQIADSARALDEATGALTKAQKRLDAARSGRDELSERAERYWTLLDEARTDVAAAEPPVVRRKDLGSEWTGFLEWAEERAATIERDLADEREELTTLGRSWKEQRQQIVAAVMELDVDVPEGADPAVVIAAHRATLAERLDRMRKDLDRKVGMAARLEGYEGDATVANALVRHLNVDGFERWLIEEVLAALVVSANELLGQLSGGAYSLAIESSDFWVVDHLNAGERRSVETLSGGETFVVSLALALSLAEHLASMSVSGTARLESVFLDEGFGTLDPETLDTVAAVIHELGSRGRTVGLITHVTELAHQIPTRFEVRKVSGSASVERVEL